MGCADRVQVDKSMKVDWRKYCRRHEVEVEESLTRYELNCKSRGLVKQALVSTCIPEMDTLHFDLTYYPLLTNRNPDLYFLKTRSLPSSGFSRYDAMYLRLHGDGHSAVVLTKDPPKFLRGCLDKGRQLFIVTKSPRTFGLSMGASPKPNATRARWESVQIVEDESDVDVGYSFGEDGTLRWDSRAKSTDLHEETSDELEDGWKGWMVCEWSLGHPQLFWITSNLVPTDKLSDELPASCERVDIVKETIL